MFVILCGVRVGITTENRSFTVLSPTCDILGVSSDEIISLFVVPTFPSYGLVFSLQLVGSCFSQNEIQFCTETSF